MVARRAVDTRTREIDRGGFVLPGHRGRGARERLGVEILFARGWRELAGPRIEFAEPVALQEHDRP
jgi:hypothetical protein